MDRVEGQGREKPVDGSVLVSIKEKSFRIIFRPVLMQEKKY